MDSYFMVVNPPPPQTMGARLAVAAVVAVYTLPDTKADRV